MSEPTALFDAQPFQVEPPPVAPKAPKMPEDAYCERCLGLQDCDGMYHAPGDATWWLCRGCYYELEEFWRGE